MAFDPSKPVQTRDGRKARIICLDKKGDFPIVALVSTVFDEDDENPLSYTAEGRYYKHKDEEDSVLDLVNIPQRRPHADLIIAWANGAEIETYHEVLGTWVFAAGPLFASNRSYRIKPE